MSESDPGKVSVIVPARNEEANIERLVRSLASQRSVGEIFVVDDQSEDRTREILEGMRAEVPLLRILSVDSLPEGWLGKSYAVSLGADPATRTRSQFVRVPDGRRDPGLRTSRSPRAPRLAPLPLTSPGAGPSPSRTSR